MRHDSLPLPGRWRLVALCLTYAVLMLYSSTIVGPAGFHFVDRDPAGAFRLFLLTRFVAHGSDQRADWIGNLMMLVPFGFLVTGALWPRRPVFRPPAAIGAIALCLAVILAIKYLQLFFPPRTVTLNYIAAQTLGSVIGTAGWAVWHARLGRPEVRPDLVGAFVLMLGLYAGALCVFVLMPLDFALNGADLRAQLVRLPDTFLALPGHGRPPSVRVVLIVMAAAAFIPVGMLLSFVRDGVYRVRRGLPAVTGLGLLLTAGLYALSALVISAFPAMPSILYRTGGIVAGAAAIRWLVRQDTAALRQRLGRLVPWAVVPYLLCVLLVNRLLSVHWMPPAEAVARVYTLGLLPLFDYYIVTKAEAAKNVVGHAVLYMPVGAMLWLRYGKGGGGLAFGLAAGLSLAVEVARYLRPGLEGDINAVVVAGLASMLAVRAMPVVWSMIEALGRRGVTPPLRQWDKRGDKRGVAGGASGQASGEVEHF